MNKEFTAVALGYFDGVHLGHRAVLKNVVNSRYLPAVFTFHYEKGEGSKGKLLFANEDKICQLRGVGIERVLDLPYSAFCHMDGETFFNEILLGTMNCKLITCGEDFRFGKGAAWNVRDLQRMCDEASVELIIEADVRVDGVPIHSSAIRTMLSEGNIIGVNRMLGRPYSHTAEIIHGNQLGRTVGMPTANMAVDESLVLPRFGVYASRIKVNGCVYGGITNVGYKPTVGSDRVLYETYIFDFAQDIYGEKATVELLGFIRPEQKFTSLQEVRQQVQRDIETAKTIL